MQPEAHTYYGTIHWLWQAGLRFGGVIDLGCADGHFSVNLAELGPARGSAILNVDAQEDYRESLAAIQAALGGHFRLCAVGEHDGGNLELLSGGHVYWSSVRAAGDRYWASVNDLHGAKTIRVPLRSLDSLVAETGLPGPYLLKLDVQGAEADALAGGRRVLADTDVVVVEVIPEDFASIHHQLAQAEFELFDISELFRAASGLLAQFYAVYLKSKHRALRPLALWDSAHNDQVLAAMRQRREQIQNEIWASLDRYREGEWPPLPAGPSTP